MSYEEFILSLKKNLSRYFAEQKEAYKTDTVSSYGVNDTNNDRINIWNEEEKTGISFRLSLLYEQYIENGLDINSVVRWIGDTVKTRAMGNSKAQDILSMVTNWDVIKNRLSCKLINGEENKDYLQDKPYTYFQDLAVIYKIILERSSEGVSSITVTNSMLSACGVSKEELHEAAMENMVREKRSVLIPLWEIAMPYLSEEKREEIERLPELFAADVLVLTNSDQIDGACEILNPEIQEKIAEKVGGDYFVLPSSVHELIIVAKLYSDMDDVELQENVKMINETCVRPEERLSDNVYEYNAKTKTLMICGAERNKEQEHPISEAERDGLELALDYGLTDDLEYTEEELQQVLDQRQEIKRENKYQERSIRHGRR